MSKRVKCEVCGSKNAEIMHDDEYHCFDCGHWGSLTYKTVTHCPICGEELAFPYIDYGDGESGDLGHTCYSNKLINKAKDMFYTSDEDITGCEVCGNYDSAYPACQDSCPMFD